MATPIKAKKITELPENTTISDDDLFVTGMGGTSAMGKTKWSKILDKIRSVLFANNLTTNTSGYGMDARQGPVIDKRINELNTKAITGINTINIDATMIESSYAFGGYFAQIDMSNNEIAKNAKAIIPLGGCLADGRGGRLAIASPYNSSGSHRKCTIWIANAPTADTYKMTFLCLS